MMSNKSIPKTIACPYDIAHQIDKDRMQTHLIKCRRNFTDLKWVECLFNVTHQVPEQELSYHLEHCADRLRLDKHTYVPETAKDKYPVAPLVVNCTYWEEDNVPAYDPQEHCKNNPVLRNAAINTKSAAVRRNFRLEERQRMQQFAGDNQVPQQSTSQDRVPNQPRRPIKESGGVVNRKELPENDRLDIAQLMEKITLDSKIVVTPKINVSDSKSHNNPEQSGVRTGHFDKNEFPMLGGPQVNRGPMKASNSNKSLSSGRGRGKNK